MGEEGGTLNPQAPSQANKHVKAGRRNGVLHKRIQGSTCDLRLEKGSTMNGECRQGVGGSPPPPKERFRKRRGSSRKNQDTQPELFYSFPRETKSTKGMNEIVNTSTQREINCLDHVDQCEGGRIVASNDKCLA